MSWKKQAHKNENAVAKPRAARPAAQHVEVAAQQIDSGAVIRRTAFTPRSLNPQDMLQLQRTVGNQGVQRLLAELPGQRSAACGIAQVPRAAHTDQHSMHHTAIQHSNIIQLRGDKGSLNTFDPYRTYVDQTTYAEATVEGQSIGMFKNARSAHAEIKIIDTFKEKYTKDSARGKVLSIRMDRAPCEPCATELGKLKDEYGIIIRIKASRVIPSQKEGIGVLNANKIPFRLWTQKQIESKFDLNSLEQHWKDKIHKYLGSRGVDKQSIDDLINENMTIDEMLKKAKGIEKIKGIERAKGGKKTKSVKKTKGIERAKGVKKTKDTGKTKGVKKTKGTGDPKDIKKGTIRAYLSAYRAVKTQSVGANFAKDIYGDDVDQTWKKQGLSRTRGQLNAINAINNTDDMQVSGNDSEETSDH